MRPLVLLTRPKPQAQVFAAQMQADCPPHDLLIAPLSEMRALPFDASVLDGAQGVVLTSANAVPMVAALGAQRLPAWCVGPATANAAQGAGFAVQDGGGDAAALIATLARAQPQGRLVHPHGMHLARDLEGALRPMGINLHGVTVYEAQELAWPDHVLGSLSAAPRVIAALFSPRAATRFVQQLQGLRPAELHLVAISEGCAARLPDDLRARTEIAQSADSSGMLQAIAAVMSQTRNHGLRHAQAEDK